MVTFIYQIDWATACSYIWLTIGLSARKLTFEAIDCIKQMVLCSVGGPHPSAGLDRTNRSTVVPNRTKRWRNRELSISPCLTLKLDLLLSWDLDQN